MALNPPIQTPRRLSRHSFMVLWTSIALLIVSAAIAAVLLFVGSADAPQMAPASPRQSELGVPTAPQHPQVGPGRRIPRPGRPVAE
jgi:hypothetical protein